mmetsp:Transcript_14281/g.17983  ORF Transcript_14281/g.17983 Transcript_14281/m.17983 type:complete len:101 (+) Transcript_14281:154-456(+)
MTYLYETLGVKQDATTEEIKAVYERLREHFDPAKTNDDSTQIYFNDLTLAYKTLVNPSSRAEYDMYLEQYQAISNFSSEGAKREEVVDPEVLEERARRKR